MGNESPDGSSARSGHPKESPDGSSTPSGHRKESLDQWWSHITGSRFPRQVLKDPHESARLIERVRHWIVYVCVEGGSGSIFRPKKPLPSGGIGEASSAGTGAGGTAAGGRKGPASGGGGGPSMAELWASTKRTNYNYNRYMNRSEVNNLKKSLDSLKERAKKNELTADMIRAEQEKIKEMVDGLAVHLKAGLHSEVSSMSMSKEAATELAALINELRDALKMLRPTKKFSFKKFEDYFRTPRRCVGLYEDMQFYFSVVTAMLILHGFLTPKFEDPTPFNSRDTVAGDILFNGFEHGLEVHGTFQFRPNFISSMLSGNVQAVQSSVVLKHIRDSWFSQITILPGHDIVAKGALEKFWGQNLKLSLNLPYYNGLDRKIGFHHSHKFGSFGGSIGLTANPVLNLCALFGSKKVNAGCITDYQTTSGRISRIALGGAWNSDKFSLAGMLDTRFEEHEGVYVRRMTPSFTAHYQASDSTSVAAQLVHRVEDHHTTYTAGVMHVLDTTTTLKGRLTNDWVISALIKHKFAGCSLVLSSQFDLKVPQAPPRIGVSVSIGQ